MIFKITFGEIEHLKLRYVYMKSIAAGVYKSRNGRLRASLVSLEAMEYICLLHSEYRARHSDSQETCQSNAKESVNVEASSNLEKHETQNNKSRMILGSLIYAELKEIYS
jgi:hypothetical protein